MMEPDREKEETKRQLARCRKLADEFTEGVTAQNLRKLAAELEQRLRVVDGQGRLRD